MILAVCANEKSGIFGEQNWWFNAPARTDCAGASSARSSTPHIPAGRPPFTAAADYAVKSFAEEMEGRDLRLGSDRARPQLPMGRQDGGRRHQNAFRSRATR